MLHHYFSQRIENYEPLNSDSENVSVELACSDDVQIPQSFRQVPKSLVVPVVAIWLSSFILALSLGFSLGKNDPTLFSKFFSGSMPLLGMYLPNSLPILFVLTYSLFNSSVTNWSIYQHQPVPSSKHGTTTRHSQEHHPKKVKGLGMRYFPVSILNWFGFGPLSLSPSIQSINPNLTAIDF